MFFTKPKEVMGLERVKILLHERMRGWGTPHSTNELHASDLTNPDMMFCPREFALLDLVPGKRKGRWESACEVSTFSIGRHLEQMVREEWLADLAVGTWECRRCSHRVHFSRRPQVCGYGDCQGHSFRYLEERFKSLETGVSSGIDLLLDFPTGKRRVVEIKSIDKDHFKDLKAPMAEHRERSTLYLHCVRTSGRPEAESIDTSVAHILYVAKAYGMKDAEIKAHGINDRLSPFKEYVVPENPEMLETRLRLAKELKAFRDGEAGVPKHICATAFESRAKLCSRVKECFSGQF